MPGRSRLQAGVEFPSGPSFCLTWTDCVRLTTDPVLFVVMDDLRWIIEGALEIDPSLLEASEGARACDIPTVASLPKLDAAKAFLGRGSSPANPTNTNPPHPKMRLNCCRAPNVWTSFIDSRENSSPGALRRHGASA